MKLNSLHTYTSETVKGHLATKSGQYLKEDGTPYTYDDLETLPKLLRQADKGHINTMTDLKYVRAALGNSGDKAPENVAYFDHLVIEDIPKDIDEKTFIQAVKDGFNSSVFYVENKGKDRTQEILVVGERQILDRIETSPNGNKHLHLLVARRSLADVDLLNKEIEKWSNSSSPLKDNVIRRLNEGLDKLKLSKVDKTLSQPLSLSGTYAQQELVQNINNILTEKGIAPLSGFGSYSTASTSNIKTSSEAKQATNEIIDSGFSEKAVKEVVEAITSKEASTIDEVIIQKRLIENKKRMEEITNELQKLTSESRTLTEAQQAINDKNKLEAEVKALISTIKEKDEALKKAEEEKNALTEKHLDEIEEIQTKFSLEIQSKNDLIEEGNKKYTELENDLELLENDKAITEEALSEAKKVIEEVKGELKQSIEINEGMALTVERYKTLLEDNKQFLKEQEEAFRKQKEAMNEQIAEQAKQLEEARKEIQQLKETNSKQEENFKKIETNLQEEIKILTAENVNAKDEVQQLNELNKKLFNTVGQFKAVAENLSKTYARAINAVKTKLKNHATAKKDTEQEFTKLNTELKAIETTKAGLTETENKLKGFFSGGSKGQPQNKPKDDTSNKKHGM